MPMARPRRWRRHAAGADGPRGPLATPHSVARSRSVAWKSVRVETSARAGLSVCLCMYVRPEEGAKGECGDSRAAAGQAARMRQEAASGDAGWGDEACG